MRDQQSYAKHHDIPGVFEGLTIALLYKKPDDPIAFIAEEAKRMGASKEYEAANVSLRVRRCALCRRPSCHPLFVVFVFYSPGAKSTRRPRPSNTSTTTTFTPLWRCVFRVEWSMCRLLLRRGTTVAICRSSSPHCSTTSPATP